MKVFCLFLCFFLCVQSVLCQFGFFPQRDERRISPFQFAQSLIPNPKRIRDRLNGLFHIQPATRPAVINDGIYDQYGRPTYNNPQFPSQNRPIDQNNRPVVFPSRIPQDSGTNQENVAPTGNNQPIQYNPAEYQPNQGNYLVSNYQPTQENFRPSQPNPIDANVNNYNNESSGTSVAFPQENNQPNQGTHGQDYLPNQYNPVPGNQGNNTPQNSGYSNQSNNVNENQTTQGGQLENDQVGQDKTPGNGVLVQENSDNYDSVNFGTTEAAKTTEEPTTAVHYGGSSEKETVDTTTLPPLTPVPTPDFESRNFVHGSSVFSNICFYIWNLTNFTKICLFFLTVCVYFY